MLQRTVDLSDWKQLVRVADVFLATCDIALVNLACAVGLPGGPSIADIRECLHKLDEWARFVRRYTELSYEQYYRTAPAEYGHSEGFFRSLCLVTALQRHCGLRYNLAKIPEDASLDTADTFIHGAILGEGGTCASIPVVLAAVGRRLGYPIKIVGTRTARWGHLFARWDDTRGERLNLEATATGLGTPDDDYYRTGMYELKPEMETAGRFLKSKTPMEELAGFLAARAQCCRHVGCWRFAVEAYAYASGLAPENGFYRNSLKEGLNSWLDELEIQRPSGFPALAFQPYWPATPPRIRGLAALPFRRRFPPALPMDLERSILEREALDTVLHEPELNRKFWEPMRRGEKPAQVPVRLLVRFKAQGCDITVELAKQK